MENGIFWSEIGSGFGDQGGTPLPRIPRSTPPGINYMFMKQVVHYSCNDLPHNPSGMLVPSHQKHSISGLQRGQLKWPENTYNGKCPRDYTCYKVHFIRHETDEHRATEWKQCKWSKNYRRFPPYWTPETRTLTLSLP